MDKKLEKILADHQTSLKTAAEAAAAEMAAKRAEREKNAVVTASEMIDAELRAAVETLRHLRKQLKEVGKRVKVLDGGVTNLDAIAKVDAHLASRVRQSLRNGGIDLGD